MSRRDPFPLLTINVKLFNDYNFVPANNPANKTHDGVRLFYKNYLVVSPK